MIVTSRFFCIRKPLSGLRKVAEMPESRDTVPSGLPDPTEILLDLRVNKF